MFLVKIPGFNYFLNKFQAFSWPGKENEKIQGFPGWVGTLSQSEYERRVTLSLAYKCQKHVYLLMRSSCSKTGYSCYTCSGWSHSSCAHRKPDLPTCTTWVCHNPQPKKQDYHIFELVLRGFVRHNFIGLPRWNGRESTNQFWKHISDMEYVHEFLVLSFGVKDGPKNCSNWSRKDRLNCLMWVWKLAVVTTLKFWLLFRSAFL